MRIIGGEYGGRKINPPTNMPHTRPTTDIAKEGLFNILENNLDLSELKTLDLFGGTGSISYELALQGRKVSDHRGKGSENAWIHSKNCFALPEHQFRVIPHGRVFVYTGNVRKNLT
jgi:hypothetical protein